MRKKKKILLIVIVLLFLIVGILFVRSKKLEIEYEENIVVNINEEIYNLDNIKNVRNGNIVSAKEQIDTSKVGKFEVPVKIKNFFNRTEIFKYEIEVIDIEKPIITFRDELTIEEGSFIDLLQDVSVIDNSNEKIEVKIDGDYDFNTPGEYSLYYVAVDSSGNEARENFLLIVKRKVITPANISTMPDRNFTTSKGYSAYTKNGLTYVDGYLIVNKTYPVPASYNPGLDSTVKSQADIMFADAKALGLNIYLSSGFRSYSTQTRIYNNYVARDGRKAADTYSARPGHSEHQTGLAFDVNQIDSSFDNTLEAKWLSDNCYKYGFILRYPKGKSGITGYMYESWHFRYVGVSLATKLYNNGDWITMEEYFGLTSEYNY